MCSRMSGPFANAAPSLADFEALAVQAFAALPPEVRRACAEILVRVDDFAPDDVLDEMEIEDPYELTGLYDGIALTERSVMHQPTRPDTVWLYRRPILEERTEKAAGLHEVRYFFPGDAERADRLAEDVNRVLGRAGYRMGVTARGLTGYGGAKPRQGTLELWLEPVPAG